MNFWILLLIACFQSFISAMAEWNPDSALILINAESTSEKVFPSIVYELPGIQYKMYFHPDNKFTAVIYAYCPNPYGENQDCNYAMPFYPMQYWHELGPIDLCLAPVPYVEKTQPAISCTHNGKTGQLHRFVYLLCTDSHIVEEEKQIYEVCYQNDKQQLILGSYTISNGNLLGNGLLEDEQNYSFASQVQPHNLYNQNTNYKPRFVLPPELLPFGPQRKPLFHVTNIAPMDSNLIAVWEKLMENLKLRLSKMNEAIHVTAGLLDGVIVEGGYKHLGLIDNQPAIPIAKHWWIQIYNEKKSAGVVVMMQNEHHATLGRIPFVYFDRRKCSVGICGEANLKGSLPESDNQAKDFIFCCYPMYINRLFNLKGNMKLLSFPET